jgi:signal peptidase I
VSLQARWGQSLRTFLFPVFLILIFRWAFLEPFVIPSGSMIPTLLIHDHILVFKGRYGLHWPFSQQWLLRYSKPQRGDVVVFRYPPTPDIFYIKRLIGLPGDDIEYYRGQLKINGHLSNYVAAPDDFLQQEKIETDDGFKYFLEAMQGHDGGDQALLDRHPSHLVRYYPQTLLQNEMITFKVPEDSYFFMGDNRDQSNDSRFWGTVKSELILGKAWLIWYSCEETLPQLSYLCDPSQMRWTRFFKQIR